MHTGTGTRRRTCISWRKDWRSPGPGAVGLLNIVHAGGYLATSLTCPTPARRAVVWVGPRRFQIWSTVLYPFVFWTRCVKNGIRWFILFGDFPPIVVFIRIYSYSFFRFKPSYYISAIILLVPLGRYVPRKRRHRWFGSQQVFGREGLVSGMGGRDLWMLDRWWRGPGMSFSVFLFVLFDSFEIVCIWVGVMAREKGNLYKLRANSRLTDGFVLGMGVGLSSRPLGPGAWPRWCSKSRCSGAGGPSIGVESRRDFNIPIHICILVFILLVCVQECWIITRIWIALF